MRGFPSWTCRALRPSYERLRLVYRAIVLYTGLSGACVCLKELQIASWFDDVKVALQDGFPLLLRKSEMHQSLADEIVVISPLWTSLKVL